MNFTARQIAEMLNGRIEGDAHVIVSSISKIEEGSPGSLTFLANPKYTPFIYSTKSSVVIVGKDFVPDQEISATRIIVDDAYSAFAKLLEMYNQLKGEKTGIANNVSIHPTAKIGSNVYIGDFVFIGENAIIGDNTKIYPNASVGDNVQIGHNTTLYSGVNIYADNVIGNFCTIHSGVVIGGDGFGFAPQDDNIYKKVIQSGNVVIEDNVEIGANTTIDRATLGSTIIRKGVKLDNLIQIAHNVEIGENTVIASQTGISGSTHIGRNCMIAGQVGFVGHITIADEVKIGAQSGISSDILEKGAVVLGSPAFEVNKYKRSYVLFKNLPKITARLNFLEKQLIRKKNDE